jgi:DNA (cytosine-5)-methyltransferase 1
MRYGSVCSGIEAATQAWHGLGWEPAFFSDIEKFPVAVLQHHYPDVPVHGDFTTITEDEYGAIDLLVGGTPCQSFSVAGLRGGMDDDRGNLALEFIRLAQRKRPQWLVWENVPGVLSSNGGRDFGSFLGALAEIGYGFAYRVCDAQYWGVAQRRRRVFVVGYLGDWKRAAAVLFERESLSGNPAPSREEGEKASRNSGERLAVSSGQGWWREAGDVAQTLRAQESANKADTLYVPQPCNEVAPAVTTGPPFSRTGNERVECEAIVPVTARMRGFGDYECDGTASALKARDYKDATDLVAYPINTQLGLRGPDTSNSSREGLGIGNEGDPAYTLQAAHSHAVASNLSVRRLTPTECERLQGFPDGFTQIPWRNKPAENCPDGPRYKALGNSMAVPVMRWIGHRIQEVENVFS